MSRTWRCVTPVLVVVFFCLWGSTEALGRAVSRPRPQRPPRKPKDASPTLTPPVQDIDIQQMGGKWYLLNTASKCSYLIKHGTKVEPTVVTLTTPTTLNGPLSVSTKTRHNHQCYEILQVYLQTTTRGRLLLKGARPEHNTDIVILETDYSLYAIIYYHKYGQITMKLYGRSVDHLSEPVLEKFEQLAGRQGMSLAYLFPFPTYSHCGSVDSDHIIKFSHRAPFKIISGMASYIMSDINTDCVPTC